MSSDEEKEVRVIRNATDLQRLKLEKLMKNPAKLAFIPEKSKDKKFPNAPEFVRNVMGSSAGAGSGEFHVYRHIRRREYARQEYMQHMSEKDRLDFEYHTKIEYNQRRTEEKASKKRAKRQRAKQRLRAKRNKDESNKTTKKDESASETEESSESEGEPDKQSEKEDLQEGCTSDDSYIKGLKKDNVSDDVGTGTAVDDRQVEADSEELNKRMTASAQDETTLRIEKDVNTKLNVNPDSETASQFNKDKPAKKSLKELLNKTASQLLLVTNTNK